MAPEFIMAIPVNSKLPWMELSSVPEEMRQDEEDGKKIGNRYYVTKFTEWSET